MSVLNVGPQIKAFSSFNFIFNVPRGALWLSWLKNKLDLVSFVQKWTAHFAPPGSITDSVIYNFTVFWAS